MQKSVGLLDEPNPFGTLEIWERHLAEVEQIPEGTLGREGLLQHAREMVELMRAETRQKPGLK